MKIPRPVLLGVGAAMIAGAVLPPIVWQLRQAAGVQPGVQVVDADLASALSCDVEEACGPLRAAAALSLGPPIVVVPAGALPPGYAECAAKAIGDGFGSGPFDLAPCAAGH